MRRVLRPKRKLPEPKIVRFVVAFTTNDTRENAFDQIERRLNRELELQFGTMASAVRLGEGDKV